MGKNNESPGDDPRRERDSDSLPGDPLPGGPLPDGPLDRAALYVKRDRDHTPPSPPETAGLIRYKKGIVLVLSLLLIGISLSAIHTTLKDARPPSRPSEIVVRSPEGDYEAYPEGASLADALDRWDVDTTDIREEILATRLPTGCRVRLTGDPEMPVVLESLDARDLFILGIPFNINTASVDELSLIPGIGERLSGRIVALREEHGPFLCIEDLTAVPGIGAKKSETIMEYVIFYDMLDGPEDTQ